MMPLKQIILGALLAYASCALAMTYASSNPYCSAPGELTLGIQDQSAAGNTPIDFDSISTYYNADSESVPLMVKNGDATATPARQFTFYSYKKDLNNVDALTCGGTSAYKFVDLIGSYLFLVDNSTSPAVYYVCTYNHEATTPLIPLLLVTTGLVTGSISQFDPYLNDGTTLFVLVGNGLVSQVVSFSATDGTSNTLGNPTSEALISARGNDVFLYDETDKQFLAYSGSAWSASTSVIPVTTGKTVKVTGLRQKNLIVNLLTSEFIGVLYSVTGNTPTKQVDSFTSTFQVKSFTDDVNDFVYLTSEGMTWLTLPNSANAVIYKSTIAASMNGDLANIINVGLSGNKAVILYSNNKLEYMKHTAGNAITVLFSRSYNAGQVGSTSDGKQYKLSITCMCASVDRFACFSATLNCVIIRKAGVKCNEGTDLTSSSW